MSLIDRVLGKQKPKEELHKKDLVARTRHMVSQSFGEILQQQIEKVPHIQRMRDFWEKLDAERGWWPVLLPFLGWVGWCTYHKERSKVLAERAQAALDQAAAQSEEQQVPRQQLLAAQHRSSVVVHR
jgi:hypothetical protein